MERVNAIKAEGAAIEPPSDGLLGCPWYVASSDHHYCFWVYAQNLHGSPATEKEICDLLLITPQQLDKIQESALTRLRRPENRGALLALAEIVAELANAHHIDLTMYYPDEFKGAVKEVMEAKAIDPYEDSIPKVIKRKHPTGLPLHRDGRKVDLYGLYSHKTMEKNRDKRDDDEKDSDPKEDDSEE